MLDRQRNLRPPRLDLGQSGFCTSGSGARLTGPCVVVDWRGLNVVGQHRLRLRVTSHIDCWYMGSCELTGDVGCQTVHMSLIGVVLNEGAGTTCSTTHNKDDRVVERATGG